MCPPVPILVPEKAPWSREGRGHYSSTVDLIPHRRASRAPWPAGRSPTHTHSHKYLHPKMHANHTHTSTHTHTHMHPRAHRHTETPTHTPPINRGCLSVPCGQVTANQGRA